MGMTIAEKILAAHANRPYVLAGEYVTAKIDQVCIKYNVLEIPRKMEEAGIPGGLTKVWDKEKVLVILDYCAPAVDRNVKVAESHVETRQLAKRLGLPHFYDVRSGICHQVMIDEGFVKPGDLIVATDSHTPTYGSLNCAGTGIGEAEMAWVLAFGELWFRVPETIRITLTGQLMDGVMGKDVFLYMSGKYGTDFAQYKSIEWVGPGVDAMSLDSRMCIANQAVEIGAKFCMFEADQKVLDYITPRARGSFQPVTADADAVYEQEVILDGCTIPPMVAQPHGMEITNPAKFYKDIKIDQAVIGGCAAGRLEDIEAAARILKGRKVHEGVRCILGAANWEVYTKAIQLGYIETLLDAGVLVCHPHCGPCTGVMGTLAPGEVCITATTRNFKGRMGSNDADIYLGSPATVAASALTGYITDPREVIS